MLAQVGGRGQEKDFMGVINARPMRLTGTLGSARLKYMELRITPTPDQEAFIREGIASGRFENADAVAQLAMRQWEQYERQRAELIADIKEGQDCLDRGEGIYLDSDDAIDAFFDEVAREARAEYESRRSVHR
jgi:putative addiction module CopG family antidote